MTYSIIICTYNRAELLGQTLACLHAKFAHDIDARGELIVVDNNSTDNTREICTKPEHCQLVRYFHEVKQGLSNARNRGIEEAKGDIIIFIDDDVEVSDDWLDCTLKPFDDQSVAVVGGKVLPFNVEIPGWLPEQYLFLVSLYDVGSEKRYVEQIMGANFAVRRSAVTTGVRFDPNLGRTGINLLGGEETDFVKRIISLGYRVCYEPASIIYHKINEKLNLEYVKRNSFGLGISEAYIDKKVSYLKYAIKYFRAIIFIIIGCCGALKHTRDSVTKYIRYNYACGYVGKKLEK